MHGRSARLASCLPAALLAAISILVQAPPAIAADSLSSVISEQANLTTYAGLLKDHSAIFSKLPNSGVTVLAPSDEAFAKLGQSWNPKDAKVVEEVLQYHMLSRSIPTTSLKAGDSVFASTMLDDPAYANVTGGQKVIITKQPGNSVVITSGLASRTTITSSDIPFSQGLVQVIDSVMVTPAGLETTARDAYTDLTSFLGALYTTDLVAEFAGTPNITVFAPRNAAFQRLGSTLTSMSKAELANVLRYHLVPAAVLPTVELKNGTLLTTGADAKPSIRVTRFNNDIFVDSAQMVQTDILIANGVVQMIDNVLDPKQPDARPDVTLTEQPPVFTGSGTTATGSTVATPFASELPCTVSCPVSGGGTKTGDVSSRSSSGWAVPAAARCTGLAGARVGVAVGGVLGLELMGVI